MKVDKEMSGVLEPLSSVLIKEALVNKSRFNQETGSTLQDQSRGAERIGSRQKRTHALGR